MRGRGRLEAAPSPLIALALPPGGQRRDPRALQALGPTQVLIKRGEHGASGVDGELELEVPAYRVDVVDTVDTVGAGGAFAAGYLVELTRGGTLEQRMLTAAACGACACRSDGDWESQPSWGDVQGLVEGSGDAVLR